MPDDPASISTSHWVRALDADSLREGNPVAVKLAGKHIALFRQGERIHACNNRCPHEGYPLVEGTLDAGCRLTCHWHNWKFDLATGTNEYGGDDLRIYPVRIEEGAVHIDLADPPAEALIARSLAHLDEAMADVDAARIAREAARLARAGAGVERVVAHAIVTTHERFRYGMTHAYAGAEAWLRLRDRSSDDVVRLACVSEALAHIGFDVRGEPHAGYAETGAAWMPDAFLRAVEAQDEAVAIALINGALEAALSFGDLEPALTSAALAHYNDFGHTLIYLMHVRRLIGRLGEATAAPLLRCWVRSLVYATREDLLPDFAGYASARESWPAPARTPPTTLPSAADFEGTSTRDAIAATLSHAAAEPLRLFDALVEASARNLLCFDERHALRTDNPVSDNVGWLDFSHALTFAHALREQCARLPYHAADLWPRGLLQMALFVGRNKSYLRTDTTSERELMTWAVDDAAAFDARATAMIVDHGVGLPIFPVHWLKTWLAVADERALGLSDGAERAALAAVNRLLAVRFKQRHALRNAHQSLTFVAREG